MLASPKAPTGSSLPPLSVRGAQTAALKEMLLAPDGELATFASAADHPTTWKLLIYDAPSRDVIAPLLRVADLRAHGVTLHLSFESARQAVPDVPAVYLIDATESNVRRVAADARAGMYNGVYVNFLRSVPRSLLETLAEATAAPGGGRAVTGVPAAPPAPAVQRVWDMYSHFLALEHDLFTLHCPRVFSALNARGSGDGEVQACLEQIVDRLFCVLATLGVVPVVRAQPGGPAAEVARRLDEALREALSVGNNMFDGAGRAGDVPGVGGRGERPLLVLLDRTVDLSVMLHHTWTYQALAHDSLGLHLNRVSVPVRDDGSGAVPGRPKVYDLDKADEFWSGNAGLPFPMVAEAVEGALADYKEEVVAINRSANLVGTAGEPPLQQLNGALVAAAAGGGGAGEHGAALAAAIASVPELTKKKAMIDVHTNIATALLDCIKTRGLDGFYQVEEELLTRPASFDVERILSLLRDPRGAPLDKLRLFLIYYLSIDGATEAAIASCTSALAAAGASDLRAFEYLKSIKAFTYTMASVGSYGDGGVGGGAGDDFNQSYKAVLGTLSQVAANVGSMILTADKALPTARIVSSLMDQKGDAEVLEGYLTFDARSRKGSAPSLASKRTFREAIVFMVGPGNYIEYQNCQDHICRTVVKEAGKDRMVPNGKTVVYGASEMCNGNEFVEQLADLFGALPA